MRKEKIIKNALKIIKSKIDYTPDFAIILGSGLGGLVDILEDKKEVAYKEIKGMPISKVKGHAGKFVFGKINEKTVVCISGRIHMYEGYDACISVLPLEIASLLGTKNVIITNASGSLNENIKPGDIMQIVDHINFTARTPLKGAEFIDMSEPYDLSEVKKIKELAQEMNLELKEGVYVQTLGPSYETNAEIKMFSKFGDAVGMSTVVETIFARSKGMKVVGFSVISNFATGLSKEKNEHEDVLKVVKNSTENLKNLLIKYIKM